MIVNGMMIWVASIGILKSIYFAAEHFYTKLDWTMRYSLDISVILRISPGIYRELPLKLREQAR